MFALPGNPVSCIVVFELLVRPYLDALLGARQVGLVPLEATLVGALRVRPGRRQFLRALLEQSGVSLTVRPFSNQRSGVLRSLTESNALIDLPGDVLSYAITAGDPLGGFLLEDEDFRELTRIMLHLAKDHAESRVISFLEGGYSLEGLARGVRAHVEALAAGI